MPTITGNCHSWTLVFDYRSTVAAGKPELQKVVVSTLIINPLSTRAVARPRDTRLCLLPLHPEGHHWFPVWPSPEGDCLAHVDITPEDSAHSAALALGGGVVPTAWFESAGGLYAVSNPAPGDVRPLRWQPPSKLTATMADSRAFSRILEMTLPTLPTDVAPPGEVEAIGTRLDQAAARRKRRGALAWQVGAALGTLAGAMRACVTMLDGAASLAEAEGNPSRAAMITDLTTSLMNSPAGTNAGDMRAEALMIWDSANYDDVESLIQATRTGAWARPWGALSGLAYEWAVSASTAPTGASFA